jgi:hypothetical protein
MWPASQDLNSVIALLRDRFTQLATPVFAAADVQW